MMAEYVIGISAFYHDSAACLLKDGKIVAAAKEERFSRVKHDARIPVLAIEYCLKLEGIDINDIRVLAYYEKPILKFDRIVTNAFNQAPRGFVPFLKAMKSWLKEKLWLETVLKRKLGYTGEIVFTKHHESHVASAFYTSPFEKCAFLTIDGVGEKATTSFGVADIKGIHTYAEIHFPHSLGLLYSAFTYFCGFKVNSGEYKLMGLAPYGKAYYSDVIKKHLIEINSDGSFTLNMDYFAFHYDLKMINSKFAELFGREERREEDEMDEFYKDIAASIQEVIEEVVLNLVKKVKEETQIKNLCFSGGVALNCVANAKVESQGLFDEVWIQPASGDAGSALGAALYANFEYLKNERVEADNTLKDQVFLGPEFSSEEIEKVLIKNKLKYRVLEREKLINQTAQLLFEENIVGWFEGRMEFGPRALGNRSILASPLPDDMQKRLNLKIKKREGFRPFAPIVLEKDAEMWFENLKESKYMTYTYQCIQKAKIPSCVHVDGSSRVQTLNAEDGGSLYSLIKEFKKLSDCPVLINTSFNERGEPIVCTPQDAIDCFFNTEMDALVLGDFLVLKAEQDLTNREIRVYELD